MRNALDRFGEKDGYISTINALGALEKAIECTGLRESDIRYIIAVVPSTGRLVPVVSGAARDGQLLALLHTPYTVLVID